MNAPHDAPTHDVAGGASTGRVTRLAPSPTGRMHLGHAWSFLLAWCIARRGGWRIVLRMEDLDAQRAHEDAEADARWMLDWLGIDFDGEVVRQSTRTDWHVQCMRVLAEQGSVFEAPHSRAQLRGVQADDGANAPHEGDAVLRFPPSLRPPRDHWRFVDRSINHRLALEPGSEDVLDELRGPHAFDPAAIWGDPLVWLKAGCASYQLAVVADDLAQGITDVIRGEDLLPSASLQQRLHRMLGAARPRWWHLPLVRDAAGNRLAKRADALALSHLARQGATAARVRGLAAHWLGAMREPVPMDRDAFLALDPCMLLKSWNAPAGACRAEDAALAWLCSG